MRVDSNFFCTVPMADAGDPSVPPTARRFGNDAVVECYKNLVAWAKTADQLGVDTMWLTEHHFQYEGYEVLPNLIQFGQHLAMLTEGLRLGQMFNVVPQWHPLRLAEDFAIADILTGGRMEFGVGRGTVPREAWALGTVVASGDNAMSAEHDRINREIFEESMEVIKLAWYEEQFSYRGKHLVLPPDDVPDRGTMVDTLTLIPKPLRKIDIYQPVTSPETIEYVPVAGHKAVYWLQNADSQKQKWDRYAEIREACGTAVGPGEDRCLVLNLHVAKTYEQALVKGRPGQNEFNKFLSPYGRFSSYRNPDGSKVTFNHCPTVEESNEQKIQIVGSIDDAVDAIGFWRDLLDLKHICFFLDYPGLGREEMIEQLHLVVEEVFPRLGEPIERRPLTGSPLV
jgi:alkanesulfonate monooxygenase SsuD/methylene tetrahydromethanopterin reductase-like flavin-dependent oxidoreductase (luciferase family)